MKRDARVLIEQAGRIGLHLPDAPAERLLAFEGLLRERAVRAGFISAADRDRIRERHLLDCLRAAGVVRPTDQAAYDLGTGAGLPGIVIASALPHLQVTLVERRSRRAAFCELVVERLALGNVRVAASSIEELVGRAEPADLCFARALAPLAGAWRLAERLLASSGRLVYFAGARARPPFEARGARLVEVVESSVLEASGPLVIMARQ